MVWGSADLHFHLANHLGFGGRLLWGTPEDAPPRHCEPAHGIGGTGLGSTLPVLSWLERTGYGAGIGHLTGGHPEFDGWPRFTTVIHQQGHVDWIRRAFDSGLRLLVALVGNNEMLADLLGGVRPADDRTVVEDQVAYMKDLAARHDFLAVATTPAEARATIAGGRLAVVLGVEVDNLGGFRKDGQHQPAEVTAYLEHLHRLGVRHVFPVHMANNALAGCALYQTDLFYVLQLYLQQEPFQIEDGSASGVEFRFELPGFVTQVAEALGLDPGLFRVPAGMGGHVNGRGLLPLGRHAIAELMRMGFVIDVDHMSQKALDETLRLAEERGYPVVSGHTGFRELAWSRRRGETAANEKAPSETLKTARDLERIRALGGMVAPILHQGDVRPARQAEPAVPDRGIADCAGSSTSWAQAYLYAVAKMGGRGVGFGSDCNGFAQLPAPRFGPNAAYGLHSGQQADPVRRARRAEQVARQRNGVRYGDPVRDWRAYRWLEGVTADELVAEQRDMWQAIAVVRAGCDVWADRAPDGRPVDGIAGRVRNFARGLTATSDEQLWRPDVFNGDAPWEQRTGFLLATGQVPGTGPRDPAKVHELFRWVAPVYAQAGFMAGDNPPLTRSVAGRRDFDVNVDGMAHYGMLPDFVQDLRNVGLTNADLAPLFSSAEEYLRVWERCVETRPRLLCDRVEVVGIDTADRAAAVSWDGAWREWVPVGTGVFRAGSPLALTSRDPSHVDAFAVGLDGRVWTCGWDGRWRGWGPLGTTVVRPDSPLAVVAREPGRLDVFAVDPAGHVVTAVWDGGWREWTRVGSGVFRAGSPVAVVSRHADRVDLFASGMDGRVWTTWWDGRWRDWAPVGAAVHRGDSPIAVVARKPERLDVFAVDRDGHVVTAWWDGRWHEWARVGAGVFRPGSGLVVVSRTPESLDVFAVGMDGRLWTVCWDGRRHDWVPVGDVVLRADSPVVAVSRGPGHLDVFGVGTDDRLRTAHWAGGWQGWVAVGATTLRGHDALGVVCR